MLKRQVDFNAEIVRLLNQLVGDYRYRVNTLEQQLIKMTEEQQAQQKGAEALSRRLADLVQEIRAQKISVEDLLAGLRSGKGAGGTGPAAPEEGAERLRAFEYLLFENRHRGSEAEIKGRQQRLPAVLQEFRVGTGYRLRPGGIPGAVKRGGYPGPGGGIKPRNGSGGATERGSGHPGGRFGTLADSSRTEIGWDFSYPRS